MIWGIVILMIAGGGTVAAGVFLLCYQIKWQKGGKLIYGFVTLCYISCYDSPTYTKMVEYEINGTKYEGKVASESKIKKGKKIPLLYKPESPNYVIHYRPVRMYVAVAIIMAIGIGCFVGAFDLIQYFGEL